MIGGDLVATPVGRAERGDTLVRAVEWTPHGGRAPLSFELHAGEIAGVAAIDGNGQRAMLRALAGIERSEGTLEVRGPVAFLPEDRTTEGLIGEFTLAENILLGTLGRERWIDWAAIEARTAALLLEFDVRAEGPRQLARSLSGGNQQKVLFARALSGSPRVIVVEDPTRGLDVQPRSRSMTSSVPQRGLAQQ